MRLVDEFDLHLTSTAHQSTLISKALKIPFTVLAQRTVQDIVKTRQYWQKGLQLTCEPQKVPEAELPEPELQKQMLQLYSFRRLERKLKLQSPLEAFGAEHSQGS